MTLLRAICITLSLMQSGSPLTPAERALVSDIDAHHDDALALLERVVNINSGMQDFEGVREVGRVFRTELDALGFTTPSNRQSLCRK
jgi:glutamate carboxypeptidase